MFSGLARGVHHAHDELVDGVLMWPAVHGGGRGELDPKRQPFLSILLRQLGRFLFLPLWGELLFEKVVQHEPKNLDIFALIRLDSHDLGIFESLDNLTDLMARVERADVLLQLGREVAGNLAELLLMIRILLRDFSQLRAMEDGLRHRPCG